MVRALQDSVKRTLSSSSSEAVQVQLRAIRTLAANSVSGVCSEVGG